MLKKQVGLKSWSKKGHFRIPRKWPFHGCSNCPADLSP
jgi:hypothetical protein